ncbi:hypothetical protein [Flammeovirga sp. SJP92]|uniref:hypothetical protein n=1 Tax=Flammeovirga sp. SJP92 TaxID=1775430 RepID=UPI0007894AEB|nr:hypothetical protein [Flammeovirga sp. SJP92]KXX71367.1 hypothetical protein AVL50_32420 [Flammeovirga sp. SJP92]
MKRLLFIITLFFINNFLQAQDSKFTFGVGTGITIYIGEIDDINIGGVGGSFNVNFYYNHTSHWSFGFERNGNTSMQVLSREQEDEYLSILPFSVLLLSNVVDYTLKAKYYIGKRKVRTHIALGLGYYRTKSVHRSDDDNLNYKEVPLKRYEAIGLSPELGINFGIFQLSFISDIIPSTVLGYEGNSYFTNFIVRATFNISTNSKKKTKE